MSVTILSKDNFLFWANRTGLVVYPGDNQWFVMIVRDGVLESYTDFYYLENAKGYIRNHHGYKKLIAVGDFFDQCHSCRG